MGKYEELYNKALGYMNPFDFKNYNMKKAKELMKQIADDGYLCGYCYMYVFAVNDKNEEEKTKWINEIKKVNMVLADTLIVKCDINSEEYKDAIKRLKSIDLSYYYSLDYLNNYFRKRSNDLGGGQR